MTLAEAKAYQSELKAQGDTQSTSKEAGKVADYIATLQPERFGEERVTEAYRKLTRGVTERGGFTETNLPELEARGIPNLLAPISAEQLPDYLGEFQDGVYGAASSPELRESILTQVEPEGGRPDPLDRIDEYERLRGEQGVEDLEATLTDLKAGKEELYATRRLRSQEAEGQPVPLGVIAGRVGEIERQENERIDAINREINTVVDQLQTSYAVIETYMSFLNMDYQDAVNAYNTEFSQNMQIYQLVDAEMDEREAAARSNLQIYMNAITSGNLNYGDLSGDQKLTLNKLEVQSGLPVGFTSTLKMNPKDRILATSSDKTEAWVLDSNGNMTVIKTGLTDTSGGGGASSSSFRSALATGRSDLEKGYDWGSVWDRIRSQFPDASNEDIDAGLGTQFREEGAYEEFRAKTGTTSASTQEQIAEAKVRVVEMGGSPEDLQRVETDSNFRAWVLSQE